VTAAGLFIDSERPFVGASPDGIVNCTCCGKGVLEVKCPLRVKDGLPEEDKENFCMTQKDGKWILRRDHAYYYQVQTQLNVCNVVYSDFIVWTEMGIAVERISKDFAFYEAVVEDIKYFFYIWSVTRDHWKVVYKETSCRLQWCCPCSIA